MKDDLEGLWWLVKAIASLIGNVIALLIFLYLLGVL